MDIKEALAVLALVGSDTPPTSAELATARDEIARAIHANKGSGDLAALMSLRDAYNAANLAFDEAVETEKAAEAEADDVLAGIPNPDAELSAEGEEEAAANEPSGRMLTAAEALQRLGLSGAAQVTERTPVEEAPASSQTLTLGGKVKNDATWGDIGKTFATESRRNRKDGRTSLLQIETQFSEKLPGDALGNTALLDQYTSPEAVVAAGGCCSIPAPIYDNPVNASLARPIRDALPNLAAPRGAVTYYPAICLPDQGAALWTCEDDLAVDPDDETTWKQCFDVDCSETETTGVEAIYSCLGIGNYQQKFAPEQWTGHLRALAALQSRVAETALFDKMRAGVKTTHTATDTGSIYVTLLNTIGRASAALRQDQRLEDVQMRFFAPEWLRAAVRADMRARRIGQLESPEVLDTMLTQALANEGVNVTWTLDVNPLAPTGFVDGPIPAFLDTANTVLAPEGYFTYLDGGTLDLGTEIRDGSDIRQNKVSAFAESFEGLLARGCNAFGLDLPVSVCDDAFCGTLS